MRGTEHLLCVMIYQQPETYVYDLFNIVINNYIIDVPVNSNLPDKA